MHIDDILRPDCVIPELSAATKEEALTLMGRFLLEKGYVKDSFIQAILERERNYPSGLPMEGHKIAIPHTDSEHVNRSVILFARLTAPLEFASMGAPDETFPVRMISMFALAEKKQIGALLEILINTYQDNDTLEAILNARDGTEMYQILRSAVGAAMRGEEEGKEG